MVESGKQLLYQINLCKSLTRLPIFIVLSRPEAPNSPKPWKSPQLPQREQICSNYVNPVSRACACSSHQGSSRSLHSKRFPRFPFSPPYVLGSDSNWKWSIWNMRSFYTSSFIKIQWPIRKIKIPQFSRFPRFPVSPSNSPHCHRIWSGFEMRALKHKILLNIKFH